jgi:cephalosporin-C deacetylase-like acetyl esterase
MKNIRTYILFFLILPWAYSLNAQPDEKYIKVVAAPDHPDWLYKTGEEVFFRVSVLKDGNPIHGINIDYEIRQEKMHNLKEGTIQLDEDFVSIGGGTLENPGFLRCWATVTYDGKAYKGYATAGFDPERIDPTTTEPDDFTQFWIDAKNELASIPMDAKLTLLPDRCTEKVQVYHVSIQNYPENSRIYGILCIPNARGKYPAVLRVPGAGIRPYYGDITTAERGAITFQIGIHGIPVTMERYVYENLRYGALQGYNTMNLDNKDDYYYKRVYLSCVRSIDFIHSLEQFDGINLAVAGGSQGGALSIITAGLDDRVKWIVPYYPALCDLTGYVYGRAGGWPHMFRNANTKDPVVKAKIKTSEYYDVVNFARYVQAEGFYSWGFNDDVCPPTSMYSAYNVIDASKQLFLAPETGHWTYPEQHEKSNAWLFNKLGID